MLSPRWVETDKVSGPVVRVVLLLLINHMNANRINDTYITGGGKLQVDLSQPVAPLRKLEGAWWIILLGALVRDGAVKVPLHLL